MLLTACNIKPTVSPWMHEEILRRHQIGSRRHPPSTRKRHIQKTQVFLPPTQFTSSSWPPVTRAEAPFEGTGAAAAGVGGAAGAVEARGAAGAAGAAGAGAAAVAAGVGAAGAAAGSDGAAAALGCGCTSRAIHSKPNYYVKVTAIETGSEQKF